MRHLAAVELEVALARQQQRVVDGLGAVHEFGRAGGEFDDPNNRALPRADIIVAGDEPFALGSLARLGIVGRHPVGRPDFAPGDLRAAQPADRREPLVSLDHRIAVRVVPGDDTPYFESHVRPPLMTFRESGYSPGDWPCYSSGTASTAPIDSRSSC